MLSLVAVFIILTASQSGTAQQCGCTGYTVLSEPFRSTTYVPSGSEPLLCDDLLEEGCYRFTHRPNIKIPEACVAPNHCGTLAPIWLNGEHPTDDTYVTRAGCINQGRPGDCCTDEVDIGVQKCLDEDGATFYVYRLTAAPGCDIAYCGGDYVTCEANKTWSSFYQRCIEEVPIMDGDPVLSPPKLDLDKVKVTFTCEIKYNKQKDDGARFAVTFLFDHTEYDEVNDVTKLPLTPTKKTIELDAKFLGDFKIEKKKEVKEDYWDSKMGKTVSCVVQSYWKDTPEQKSKEIYSNGYWAGIAAEKGRLTLPEDANTKEYMNLYATVPFVCSTFENQHASCSIRINLVVDRDARTVQTCGIDIQAKSWNPEINRAYADRKRILAAQDKKDDGDHVFAVEFGTIKKSNIWHPDDEHAKSYNEWVPHIYDGYAPESIQVVTVDSPTGHCKGVTDPHYTTFDGRYYTHFLVGQFVFSRNTERNFEVHVRTFVCGAWRASCHCGVAVREGNDVVMIDLCHTSWGDHQGVYPKITEKTAHGQALSPGVAVYRSSSGKDFSIGMPSGTSVRVNINKWGMDVHLFALGIDKGETDGLCGDWDGNRGNDFKMRDGATTPDVNTFARDWRVPEGESLFERTPDVVPDETDVSYCTCSPGKNIECSPTNNAEKNTIDGINIQVQLDKQGGNIARRRKRAIDESQLYSDDVDDSGDYAFDFGENHDPPEPQWPTPTLRITEAQARAHCRETIANSSVADACSGIGLDIFAPVEGCVADIQLLSGMPPSTTNKSLSWKEYKPERVGSSWAVGTHLTGTLCSTLTYNHLLLADVTCATTSPSKPDSRRGSAPGYHRPEASSTVDTYGILHITIKPAELSDTLLAQNPRWQNSLLVCKWNTMIISLSNPSCRRRQ